MKLDDYKPTLGARLHTVSLLLAREANDTDGPVEQHELERLRQTLLNGWREVMRIRARALIECVLQERQQPR